MKRFLQTAILVLVVIILPLNCFACTGVYVGRDASADGTVILGKSNDYQDVWPNHVAVTERAENAPGRSMPVDNDRTVFAPLPATTCRYISTPWMDSTVAMNGLGYDATVCTNEYGVAMEMSITAFSNKAALAADPLVEHGLSEFTAVDLVVCQSATAREAVSVLTSLLDKYGSSEVNIALIADQKEAWYVEMYSGHQYAAVKLPDDKVSVFGNEFSLEYLSDYEESVLSPGLLSLPAENGFAVTGRNGEMNLLADFSDWIKEYPEGIRLIGADQTGYAFAAFREDPDSGQQDNAVLLFEGETLTKEIRLGEGHPEHVFGEWIVGSDNLYDLDGTPFFPEDSYRDFLYVPGNDSYLVADPDESRLVCFFRDGGRKTFDAPPGKRMSLSLQWYGGEQYILVEHGGYYGDRESTFTVYDAEMREVFSLPYDNDVEIRHAWHAPAGFDAAVVVLHGGKTEIRSLTGDVLAELPKEYDSADFNENGCVVLGNHDGSLALFFQRDHTCKELELPNVASCRFADENTVVCLYREEESSVYWTKIIDVATGKTLFDRLSDFRSERVRGKTY